MEEDIILYKIEIFKALENHFSVEIKDVDIEFLITIEDIINYIKKQKNNA